MNLLEYTLAMNVISSDHRTKVRTYDYCHRNLLFYFFGYKCCAIFKTLTRESKRQKSIERAFKVNRIQIKSGLSGLKHS